MIDEEDDLSSCENEEADKQALEKDPALIHIKKTICQKFNVEFVSDSVINSALNFTASESEPTQPVFFGLAQENAAIFESTNEQLRSNEMDELSSIDPNAGRLTSKKK